MSPRTYFVLVLVLVPALLLGACGKGYDQEIILQLFRPLTTTDEKVTLTATQDGKSDTTVLESPFSFKSCSSNQVRIIPKQTAGTVHVEIAVRSLPLFSRDISVPTQNPVRIALGNAPDLMPSECAQGLVPDGGTPIRRGIGEACTLDIQCADGVCLGTVLNAEPSFTARDGYCSKACVSTDAGPGAGCPSGAICHLFRTANLTPIYSRCLKTCSATDPCPKNNPTIQCSTLDVCVPP